VKGGRIFRPSLIQRLFHQEQETMKDVKKSEIEKKIDIDGGSSDSMGNSVEMALGFVPARGRGASPHGGTKKTKL